MDRRLALLLLLVVVALTGVAYFVVGEPNTPAAPGPSEATVTRPDSTPTQPVTPADLASSATRVEVAADPADERPAIPADSTWLDVRVVDDGAPVPGALVRWGNAVTWRAVDRLPPRERSRLGSWEAGARRLGWETHADGAGVARVAGFADGGAMVFAYARDRFGHGIVGDGRAVPADGWHVELEADRTLRVQVIDVHGQPAVDVDVGIVVTQGDDPTNLNYGSLRPVTTRAPDGIAEFPHIQTWWGWNDSAELRYRAALRVLSHDDPGEEFDRAAPPTEGIVLRVPPTGSLRARLLHEGRPLRPNRVTVQRSPGEKDGEFVVRSEELDEEGWARCPHVGLGVPLTVTAQVGTVAFRADVLSAATPGQEVSVELDTDDHVALVGRLVGPDGMPLANAGIRYRYDFGANSGSGSVTTDADGRFLWFLSQRDVDRLQFHHLVFSTKLDNAPDLCGRVSALQFRLGINDLGVIRLDVGPLVVTGRVEVDPPGALFPELRIEALSGSSPREEDNWRRVPDLSISRDRDDGFEVRGETLPVRHRLTVPGVNHLPVAPIEFPVGAADVVVRVDAGHALVVGLRYPPVEIGDTLRGVLVPRDAPVGGTAGPPDGDDGRFRIACAASLAGTAQLRWPSLPRGTYQLEVRLGGFHRPLVVLDDVVVPLPDGGDPRLAAVDLGVATQAVKFVPTARVATGQRREGYYVFALPQNDEAQWVGTHVSSTGGTMLVPSELAGLFVVSKGFRPRQFACNAAELLVELEPWPTIELSVADLPVLPQGVELWLSLHAATPDDANRRRYRDAHGRVLADPTRPSLDVVPLANGHVRLPIGEGPHQVVGEVRRVGQPQARSLLRTWTPSEIVGSAHPTPVTVRCDAAELEAALRKL